MTDAAEQALRTHAAVEPWRAAQGMFSRSGSSLRLAANEPFHMCCKCRWKPFGDSRDRAPAVPKNRQIELHWTIQCNEGARSKPDARARKRTGDHSNT